jgi:hypothetical protein
LTEEVGGRGQGAGGREQGAGEKDRYWNSPARRVSEQVNLFTPKRKNIYF